MIRVVGVACALGVAVAAPADANSGGGQWTSAGGDRANTRFQASEHEDLGGHGPRPGGGLGGQDGRRRVGDARGRRRARVLPRLGRQPLRRRPGHGRRVWQTTIAALTGVPGDKARATPGRHRRHAGRSATRARSVAAARSSRIDKNTGALLWTTAGRDPPGGDHHAVGHDLRRRRLRRRRLAGGGAGRRGPGLSVLHVPRQHGGPRPRRPARSCGRRTWRRSATAATRSGAARRPSTPSAVSVYIATGNNYDGPARRAPTAWPLPARPRRHAGVPVPADDHFDADPGARPARPAR